MVREDRREYLRHKCVMMGHERIGGIDEEWIENTVKLEQEVAADPSDVDKRFMLGMLYLASSMPAIGGGVGGLGIRHLAFALKHKEDITDPDSRSYAQKLLSGLFIEAAATYRYYAEAEAAIQLRGGAVPPQLQSTVESIRKWRKKRREYFPGWRDCPAAFLLTELQALAEALTALQARSQPVEPEHSSLLKTLSAEFFDLPLEEVVEAFGHSELAHFAACDGAREVAGPNPEMATDPEWAKRRLRALIDAVDSNEQKAEMLHTLAELTEDREERLPLVQQALSLDPNCFSAIWGLACQTLLKAVLVAGAGREDDVARASRLFAKAKELSPHRFQLARGELLQRASLLERQKGLPRGALLRFFSEVIDGTWHSASQEMPASNSAGLQREPVGCAPWIVTALAVITLAVALGWV